MYLTVRKLYPPKQLAGTTLTPCLKLTIFGYCQAQPQLNFNSNQGCISPFLVNTATYKESTDMEKHYILLNVIQLKTSMT